MRTFDAGFLNRIANDPSVRPWLLGNGEIDLSATLADPRNYGLVNEYGGFVLTPNAPGVYEVHTIFMPGSKPIDFMLECQDWMFTRTQCRAITSKVPKNNLAAKGLSIKARMEVRFATDVCEFVELDILKWAMSTPALERHGKRFHALIEHARGRESHPHDQNHERAVGAALLMSERGQSVKGVDFYNRWANLAGYAPIRLLDLSPPTIDVVDAIVCIGADGMEICLCR